MTKFIKPNGYIHGHNFEKYCFFLVFEIASEYWNKNKNENLVVTI